MLVEGKGVSGDAESEGSRRQTSGPRTTNPRRGYDSWMSQRSMAKSISPKAVISIWGGYMEGKTALLPGEACRKRQEEEVVTRVGRLG